ncbi:Stk1 family PASTA domain-containing Ser/Thr kinase [Nocardioides sp. SYSU D00038]|uniref:Stk1 family PASTA domain-containing Ser/Thr kinase n=1 Tax=Nocardioides sp. SYSU D00038 TaxID=2812554 RepID=UPI0027DB732E|nr:Stk1 family PASTA domain-containing Ser/Thr kinase [Nocardioides sp. SYSU D00038]
MPDHHAREGVTAATSDPLTGRLLEGRYRIGPRIARGGMASVYEATDIRLDRTVAVKVMHPGLGDDEEFAARFVTEARNAARVSHPNIVAVYDQGTDEGDVYLAMELIPGHTLRDTIAESAPMSPARALALLEPVVSALAAAHRAGLVHRDVKPENVLIADDGRVKVADFGLAKAVTGTTSHTATGVLIGTVSYIAPELVVEGRSDARADVYAAGVILYELLTGTKPHQGETPIQVAYKHVHEDVPAPSASVGGIPEYVDALVARATARDREQRPTDAGVLLHQLRRVGTALAHGVREDPDLVADLRPRAVRTDTAEVPRPMGDTSPEPWNQAEMEALLAPGPTDDRRPQPTTALPRAATRSTPRAAAPPTPQPTPPHVPAAPVAGPSRRRRRGPLLLVLALLVAAAVGSGAWWFGWARYTTTPGLINLTQAEAVERLEEAGLDVEVGEPAYSTTVEKGLVLSSDPGAGDRVLDGGTVTIVLSLGVEQYELPRLAGLSEDEAQDEILASRMEFGRSVPRWSETVPAGTVLGSDPAAGTVLRPGSVVDIFVSQGRKPVKVGDWVGRDADKAVARLEKRGLRVEVDEEYSDDVAEGLVIDQAPRGGTLFRDDTVTLTVSLGPELVEVPGGLVASGVDAAREKLEDAGFRVDVQESDQYLGLGYVFSTSPRSGDLVPRGSTITLYLV